MEVKTFIGIIKHLSKLFAKNIIKTLSFAILFFDICIILHFLLHSFTAVLKILIPETEGLSRISLKVHLIGSIYSFFYRAHRLEKYVLDALWSSFDRSINDLSFTKYFVLKEGWGYPKVDLTLEKTQGPYPNLKKHWIWLLPKKSPLTLFVSIDFIYFFDNQNSILKCLVV